MAAAWSTPRRCATCWAWPTAAAVLDLFEKTMRGDAPAVVAALGEMHDAGADPVVILQDLLELTHWVTRLKVAPEAARGLGRQRARRRAWPWPASCRWPSLTRAWTLLMKGLQETLTAPSPLRAAEMALIRLCYAADLPSPVRCHQGAAERRGAAAAAAASAAPHRAAAVAAARPPVWRTQPVVAAASRSRAGRAAPNPKASPRSWPCSRPAARRGWCTISMHHVHEVRCEPGLIEFRPEPHGAARPGAAPGRAAEQMDRPALDRHGVVAPTGKPTLDEQKAAKARRAAQPGEADPLVQAILKTFPGAKLDAVRRKGEQTSLVAGLVEPGEEPPAGEEYPADDDIPESEY